MPSSQQPRSDKPALSPKRRKPRRPYRETRDVADCVGRLIIALGKRIATEDPGDLDMLVELQAKLNRAMTDAVAGLRKTGYSDNQIGSALRGVSKQAVQQRWSR